jgi:hypothetical protein
MGFVKKKLDYAKNQAKKNRSYEEMAQLKDFSKKKKGADRRFNSRKGLGKVFFKVFALDLLYLII